MQALVGAVTSAGATYYLDHADADLGSDKADAASPKLQIKNTRDTKGQEGERERKRLAEEMLFGGGREKLNCGMLEWEIRKLPESGKIRVVGRERDASAPITYLASLQ